MSTRLDQVQDVAILSCKALSSKYGAVVSVILLELDLLASDIDIGEDEGGVTLLGHGFH